MAKKPGKSRDMAVFDEIAQEAKDLLLKPVAQPNRQLLLFEDFADSNAELARKNPKNKDGLTWAQEVFAGLVARGYSKVEAYRASHPACTTENLNTVYPKASRLAKLGKVEARIDAIRKQLAERALMSPTETMERLSALAREGGKDSFDALVKIAQIHGLFKPEKEMVAIGPSVIVQTVDYSKVAQSSSKAGTDDKREEEI